MQARNLAQGRVIIAPLWSAGACSRSMSGSVLPASGAPASRRAQSGSKLPHSIICSAQPCRVILRFPHFDTPCLAQDHVKVSPVWSTAPCCRFSVTMNRTLAPAKDSGHCRCPPSCEKLAKVSEKCCMLTPKCHHVKPKCPILKPKCPLFIGQFVLLSFVFNNLAASFANFFLPPIFADCKGG